MTPADVDNKVLLCEADDLALNNGDPVSPWPDTSGAGHNLTTAVSAERPICRTDVWTGHKVVSFRRGAAPDIGHRLANVFALAQPTSRILALIPRGFSLSPSAMGLADGGADFTNYLALGSTGRPGQSAGGGNQIAPRQIDLNVPTVLTSVTNGASSIFEQDGVDISSVATIGASTPGGVTLGSNFGAGVGNYSEFASMDVFGVLVCSDVWTRAERLGLLDYFVRKYGLDLGATTAGVRRTARAHRS